MEIDDDVTVAEPAVQEQRTVLERRRLEAEAEAPRFPGCRPVTIRPDEIAPWEGRLEYWDAETETAWMVRETTGAAHEQPSQRLAGLGMNVSKRAAGVFSSSGSRRSGS